MKSAENYSQEVNVMDREREMSQIFSNIRESWTYSKSEGIPRSFRLLRVEAAFATAGVGRVDIAQAP